jgi:16S rRNA processing protein RimM
MRFAGVDGREAAERLRDTELFASPLEDDDAWWVHELVGADVFGRDGRRFGTVTSVVANPASDLLELDTGALVPLRFVVDRRLGAVVVDPPSGLLD